MEDWVDKKPSESKFSVVSLRPEMQDAMRAVFKAWPQVRIKTFGDEAEATEAARKEYEHLENQVNMRSVNLSPDGGREGMSNGIVHEQMDDERHDEVLSERRLGVDVQCRVPGR